MPNKTEPGIINRHLVRKPRTGEPVWFWRRLFLAATVIWSFYQLSLLVNGPDTRVNDTIAFGLLMLISVLVLGFTGLATAQDIAAIWTMRSSRPYSEESSYPPYMGGGMQTETQTYQRTVVPPDVPTGPAMPPPPGAGP